MRYWFFRPVLLLIQEINILSESVDALATATQHNTDATTKLTTAVTEGTQAIKDLAAGQQKIATFLKQNPDQNAAAVTNFAAQLENNAAAIGTAADAIHGVAQGIEQQIAGTDALLSENAPAGTETGAGGTTAADTTQNG